MRRYARLDVAGLLVVVGVLGAANAEPANPAPGTDIGTSVPLGPVSLEVTPAVGNDIDPGPPPEVVAATWAVAQRPFGSSAVPTLPFAPPLQLRLELPSLFGVTPFATSVVGGRLGGVLPSTRIGFGLNEGPLQLGTRFGLNRDEAALWIHNATFARYVRPAFDLGIETTNEYALGVGSKFVHRAVMGSVGLHPDASVPAFRLNTALFPQAGRTFSSVSTHGTF